MCYEFAADEEQCNNSAHIARTATAVSTTGVTGGASETMLSFLIFWTLLRNEDVFICNGCRKPHPPP